MAKRSAHTSPKGQRVGAKIVLWRLFWKERTARGRWPFFLSPAEFSVARRAGRQRTARGRPEDAGRRGRALDKRWFRVGNCRYGLPLPALIRAPLGDQHPAKRDDVSGAMQTVGAACLPSSTMR